MEKQSNRPRIKFDQSKLIGKNNLNRKPYADTIREALFYLLEHKMPQEVVAECERHGWIVSGEWNFAGMSKGDLAALYCTIKNIL